MPNVTLPVCTSVLLGLVHEGGVLRVYVNCRLVSTEKPDGQDHFITVMP